MCRDNVDKMIAFAIESSVAYSASGIFAGSAAVAAMWTHAYFEFEGITGRNYSQDAEEKEPILGRGQMQPAVPPVPVGSISSDEAGSVL